MIIEYRKVGNTLQFREKGQKFRAEHYIYEGASLARALTLWVMAVEWATGVQVQELVEVK